MDNCDEILPGELGETIERQNMNESVTNIISVYFKMK